MRAYLFVLIYAGMLPLALLSPFACDIAHATAIDREIGAVRWDTIWKGLLLALATLAMLRTQLRIHAFVWIVALSMAISG